MNFRVGDRVRCIEEVDFNDAVIDELGTIKYIDGIVIGVEFDEHIDGCTGMYGAMRDGYGWDCRAEDLELIGPGRGPSHSIGEFFRKQEQMTCLSS